MAACRSIRQVAGWIWYIEAAARRRPAAASCVHLLARSFGTNGLPSARFSARLMAASFAVIANFNSRARMGSSKVPYEVLILHIYATMNRRTSEPFILCRRFRMRKMYNKLSGNNRKPETFITQVLYKLNFIFSVTYEARVVQRRPGHLRERRVVTVKQTKKNSKRGR